MKRERIAELQSQLPASDTVLDHHTVAFMHAGDITIGELRYLLNLADLQAARSELFLAWDREAEARGPIEPDEEDIELMR